jgi:uncharacterized membrane protein
MEALTHTRLAPTIESQSRDLPEIGARARRFIYAVISRVEMAVYPVATMVLLAFIVMTAARHRRDAARVDQAFAATVVCGTLLAFALATGAIDVLGFAILRWPLAPYNNLGYGPLAMLSAFGLVVLISWLRRSHTT